MDTEWILTTQELGLFQGRSEESRLGFYVLLKYFQENYRFPSSEKDLPVAALKRISSQLNISSTGIKDYFSSDNLLKKHRGVIRTYMGFRQSTKAEAEQVLLFASSVLTLDDVNIPETLRDWYITRNIEIPPVFYWKRIVSGANAAMRDFLFNELYRRLCEETRTALRAFLDSPDDSLTFIKTDPGRASLETVLSEIEKLNIVSDLGLPEELTADISSSRLKPLYLRAGTESAWDFKRHPEHISLSLLALLCLKRRGEIIDALGDLIIQRSNTPPP